MSSHLQLVAILASVVVLLAVLEMVRRRRLMERYALLWLFSAVVLLALASAPGVLSRISGVIGIKYPPTALFIVAFGFVLLLLLHFSAAVSRLSDQSKVLAQRMALLEERVRRREGQAKADEEEDDSGQTPLSSGRGERRFARVGSD
jgi:hypothetical protein